MVGFVVVVCFVVDVGVVVWVLGLVDCEVIVGDCVDCCVDFDLGLFYFGFGLFV